MKEMIILVNTTKKTAYASGNKQFFNKQKDELLKIIKNPNKHRDNKNFLRWATTFHSLEDFDYLFIKCPDEGKAKAHSQILIKANGWDEISQLTLEKRADP